VNNFRSFFWGGGGGGVKKTVQGSLIAHCGGVKKEDLLLGGLMSALGDFLADKCPIRPLTSSILCGYTWVSLVKGALERGELDGGITRRRWLHQSGE